MFQVKSKYNSNVKNKYNSNLDIIQNIREIIKKRERLNYFTPDDAIKLDSNLLFVNDLPVTYPFKKHQVNCKTTRIPKFLHHESDLSHYIAIMKRDRTGSYYKSLSNLIHNDEKAHEYLFTFLKRYISQDKKDPTRKSYIRLNKNKEIEIFSYSTLRYECISIINTYHLTLSRLNSSYRFQAIRVYPNDFRSVIDKINNRLFGTTNSYLISKIRPSQDNDKWGVFDSAFGFNQVPSYKSICFETLKHEFLINKEDGLKQIKSLPFDLLQEFIEECCKDERPIGFEIVNTLYNDKEERSREEKAFNSLYPLDKVIASWLNRDLWYRDNYENNFTLEPYRKNILINVYKNYNQFVFKKLPENVESRILMKSNSKITTGTAASSSSSSDSNIGKHSIVNKKTFLKNFNQATNNFFKDKGLGKNVLFIGGIITHCLTGQKEGFESSDIDICILHNEDFTKAKDIIRQIFGDDDLNEKGISLNVLGGHAVFSFFYPDRPIQINLYSFKDIQDVLLGVDIDCSCFAFNGRDVFTLERGMASLNYRINIASEFSYHIRGENQYQRRLLKYLDRGFDIFYHSTPSIENIITNFDINNTSVYQSGFELLLSAKHNKEIHESLLKTNKQRSLPYGPGWKKENFDKYMQDSFDIVYDGYSSCGVYCPCEDIDSIFHYRVSEREPLNNKLNWDFPRFPEQYKYIKQSEEDKIALYGDFLSLDEYLNLDSNGEVNQKTSKSLKLNQDESD